MPPINLLAPTVPAQRKHNANTRRRNLAESRATRRAAYARLVEALA